MGTEAFWWVTRPDRVKKLVSSKITQEKDRFPITRPLTLEKKKPDIRGALGSAYVTCDAEEAAKLPSVEDERRGEEKEDRSRVTMQPGFGSLILLRLLSKVRNVAFWNLEDKSAEIVEESLFRSSSWKFWLNFQACSLIPKHSVNPKLKAIYEVIIFSEKQALTRVKLYKDKENKRLVMRLKSEIFCHGRTCEPVLKRPLMDTWNPRVWNCFQFFPNQNVLRSYQALFSPKREERKKRMTEKEWFYFFEWFIQNLLCPQYRFSAWLQAWLLLLLQRNGTWRRQENQDKGWN